MAKAIPITRTRASNPDLQASVALFDDVLDRLAQAVALEEDPHDPRRTDVTPDTVGAVLDAAMTDAVTALARAVEQPRADHPAAWMLFSALHTLNLALASPEDWDRKVALGLASRHPALNPLESGEAGGLLVAARIHDLRRLIERLETLTAADPRAAPVASDAPGF